VLEEPFISHMVVLFIDCEVLEEPFILPEIQKCRDMLVVY